MATCYRHPSRETGVSCSNCGNPICPDCMTATPVGMRCPECSKQKTKVRTAASVGASATAQLKVCGTSARLALAGMNAPPEGRIYELWLDDPSDRQGPKAAGLFSVRNGRASVDVGELKGRTTVLVTDEPLPNGSEVPTRRPVVKAIT